MSTHDIEDIYELSPLQQAILFHTLYAGDTDVYVNQRSFYVDGPLDVDTLLLAWEQTARAHTILRTSFHWEGLDKPVQVVHRDVPSQITRYDWSGEPDQQERFDRLRAEDLTTGFDPAVVPLQRLHLVKFDDRRHGVIWTNHLLLLDGWSVPIFLNDVLRRYANLAFGTPPPEPAPPYRDYIAWLQRQDLDAAKDFWSRTLSGRAGSAALAPLLPANPHGAEGTLDERTVRLPGGVETRLRDKAARHRVTLNTVLHAAWALVLQRFSGEAEVMFGVTSAGRPPEVPRVDRMMGLLTNTLPVHVTVPDDGEVGPWLHDIQTGYTAVRRYEYSPLAQIKQWIGATGTQPLFNSLFIFDNYSLDVSADELGQLLSVRPVDTIEKTSQPLVLTVTPEPHLALRIHILRERFVPGAADEILDCFQAALAGLAEHDRVAEVAATLPAPATEQGPVVNYRDADATLPELIERQAAMTPDAVAVVTDDEFCRYGELLDRARQAAAVLGTLGVGPGDVVGICAERSLHMVTGILGALFAGAAYLPLDPTLPAARLAFMLADADARAVIATPESAAHARAAGARTVLIPDGFPATEQGWVRPAVSGADAAYVMYTSGSTGRPKGVVITHRAVVNRLLWTQQTFGLTADDRVMQKTPFGFDVSVWELFWPLISGATMVVAAPGGHQDAEYLAEAFIRHKVTTAHFVPSMLQLFVDEPAAADLPLLRRVICSGEALPYPLARRFRELLPDVGLHNLYGPTEATVDVTWWDCSRPGPPSVVPIGFPVANTGAYVLDRRLQEVPVGVPGELYLSGVQLARGYLARPGLTASTFVAHPLAGPGGRLYRTGDKARRLRDGSLEFLGRLDHQVKLRGYRIELGEIEQVLAGHPGVREAVVVACGRDDSLQLAAYFTVASDTAPDQRALREHLQTELPRYMLPATFTVLPAMPLTHNGKLDRAALPALAASGAKSPVRAPQTASTPAAAEEEAVLSVYREILNLTDVDTDASFFDLGGNSYDAVRAIRRIEGATVGLLVANPSARALAAALRSVQEPDGILLRLTGPALAGHTLVCVPFGGGSAISYRPLAEVLPPEVALHAVTLPGHDIGGHPELRPLEDVAQETVEAVLRSTSGPTSVYGHCAGVALAVEVARLLEAAGRHVERVLLGGSFPFYDPGPVGRVVQRSLAAMVSRGWLRVSANTVGLTGNDRPGADVAEMRYLRSIGGFEGVVDDEVLAFVMRAFRHDVAQASRYFSTRWTRKSDTPPLAAPITFIAGTDDPLTPRYEQRWRMWERFSRSVELTTVPGGGHYFHQQQPEMVAKILESTLTSEARR
ncbi:amino acid adenylation domain-containing protein [Solwaraspora sp. WMMB762]|uniref:amino acid adenylation domain-containing protein n=1 Tax=Solwaraspora sp. WMMB762 TaxID=3404120 RepID=UPI003B95CEBB